MTTRSAVSAHQAERQTMDEQAWLRFWVTFAAALFLPAIGGGVVGWLSARRRRSRQVVLAAGIGIAAGLMLGFVCVPFVISATLR